MATNNIRHLSAIAATAVFLPMPPGCWRTSIPPNTVTTGSTISNSSSTRGSTTSKPLSGMSGIVGGR
ncbi:hypothetical protein [Kosakonia radicincitans]|uniref:hypothetical protein n=1 Tax=Kosakonia radicincitans TaxID=283686 RepID=UPI001D096534|nr:hypothetical protein [Kosakonia radicincitans]